MKQETKDNLADYLSAALSFVLGIMYVVLCYAIDFYEKCKRIIGW